METANVNHFDNFDKFTITAKDYNIDKDIFTRFCEEKKNGNS
jgi:hypothetical protein